jgi:uncharacterized protein (TIGR02145 family)
MEKPRIVKSLVFWLSLAFSFNVSAQAPQGIPYQAIARNASGVAIANTAVKVRFSIRDSIATGAIKYQETHIPTTSALGLFSVNVGMGTVVSGTFSGINWGKNAKFLQVELNTTGGTTYTDLGTTQMMSVPYALQAAGIKMKVSSTGDTLFTGNGNFLLVPGLSISNPPENAIMDIDGNTYKTVKIGSQIWMKENLRVSRFRNGEPLTYIDFNLWNINNNSWQNNSTGAYCFYNYNYSNNSIYGKLYNIAAVLSTKGLCPTGWHVPSDAEWLTLENFLGGVDVAGKKMKANSSLWSNSNSNSDESGFSGLPGGTRLGLGEFVNSGVQGGWWSTTYFSTPYFNFMCHYLSDGNDAVARYTSGYTTEGLSVRCLKD